MAAYQKNFGGSYGSRSDRPDLRQRVENMLLDFVSPAGDLQVPRAQGLLDLIGKNLVYVKRLTPLNISALHLQHAGLQWPIYSGAYKEAGLELLPGRGGKGLCVLRPVGQNAVEEKQEAKEDRNGAISRTVGTSVSLLNQITADLRHEAESANTEKERVRQQMLGVISKKPEGFQAAVAEMRARLADLDASATEGIEAAEHLEGQANRFGGLLSNMSMDKESLALAAMEIGGSLTHYTVESDMINQTHASLSKTVRLVRGYTAPCQGKAIDWEPVPCVYDLERDFVRNEAWERAINNRCKPPVDAQENAAALAACLRERGASDVPENPAASKVTSLAFHLVSRVGDELGESEANKALATYFCARALNAPFLKMPAVRIAPDLDRSGHPKPEVTHWELMGALKKGIELARRTMSEVVARRQVEMSESVDRDLAERFSASEEVGATHAQKTVNAEDAAPQRPGVRR